MRLKPTVQDMTAYTKDDIAVWQLLFDRQMKLLQDNASCLYLDAIRYIGFRRDEIPCFEQANKRLQAITGWQLTVAQELVPEYEFFSLLSQRVFPATCWLRCISELDYLEEPDMFHDVFGHAPLLIHKEYGNFMEGFGKLAMKWSHHPEAISLLSRVYWYTIEFGLLREGHIIKIFGAGILSSIEETNHALGSRSRKLPFAIDQMLATAYRTDVLQETYFVLDSFTQLCGSLPVIDKQLANIYSNQGDHIISAS